MVTIKTASSVWEFNPDSKTYTRRPRNIGDDHPYVPYADTSIAYVHVSPTPVAVGDHLHVINADGTAVTSGRVVEVDYS